MLSYILRSIDPHLWDRVKRRLEQERAAQAGTAGDTGLTLRARILALLALYADHGLDALRPHKGKR